jgi:hypothetical protein
VATIDELLKGRALARAEARGHDDARTESASEPDTIASPPALVLEKAS